MRKLTLVIVFLSCPALSTCGALSAAPPAPVPVVLDTDMGSDVDDVGAVAVLHALANRGEAKILAMGVSIKNEWTPLCLDALNTYFHRPEIPLGVVKGPALRDSSKYARQIAQEFPHALQSADSLPDAALLYRKILARQPDRSVVLISIGTLTNLRNLLQTQADESSPLSGVELVKQKVRAWVCMGGKFPKGREFNLVSDGPAAAGAIRNWPTPIVFSGHEIGNVIMTGPGLEKAGLASPVRRAFELYNGLTPRASYDQTAILYAVRGFNGGLTDIWSAKSHGYLDVANDGSDVWRDSNNHRQAYLVEKAPPSTVAKIIEDLMLRPAAHK
jgi:Inosine-uridine preferring nucleoside hydrolase